MTKTFILAAAVLSAIAVSGAAGVRDETRFLNQGIHTGALRTNPPPAHTGGFGEPTCRKCHQQYDLNDSTGSLGIEGIPERWKSGERYRITITVSHRELVVAGFQIAARYDEADRAGKPAGRFETVDSLVTIARDSLTDIKYAQHSTAGVIASAPQRGSARFTLDWIAPEDPLPLPIVFHVVANAGNDDFSELGDYIFARAVRIAGSQQP